MKNPLDFLGLNAEEFYRAEAAGVVSARFEARKKEAIRLPRGTLLERGNAPTILDAAKYYSAPLVIPGGLVGIRLFFARMSDDLRSWTAPGSATLYKCGEHFVLQAADAATPDLQLSFDGRRLKRVLSLGKSGRVGVPTQPQHRGSRLA